jgi:hypothetical protein
MRLSLAMFDTQKSKGGTMHEAIPALFYEKILIVKKTAVFNLCSDAIKSNTHEAPAGSTRLKN